MKKLLSFAILLFTLTQSVDAQKFGFVNSEELILSLPEMQTANTSVEALRDSLTGVGQKMISTLETKYKELEGRVKNLSPNDQKREVDILKAEEQGIYEFEQKSQTIIMLRSQELINPIQKKISDAIKSVAEEGKFTFIFDKSIGDILYADEATNVTGLVKSKL